MEYKQVYSVSERPQAASQTFKYCQCLVTQFYSRQAAPTFFVPSIDHLSQVLYSSTLPNLSFIVDNITAPLIIMVKFRGIDVSIISQFDIRKLPEFRLRHQSPSPTPNADGSRSPSSQAVASCYVPTYPGSQIWFEYCIDGPHPPGAAYFFKFLLDSKLVTSWDCTEKHDYRGKMMYNLSVDDDGFSGEITIIRQALKFTSELESVMGSDILHKNVIEIRVHRIVHRKRVRDVNADPAATSSAKASEDGIE